MTIELRADQSVIPVHVPWMISPSTPYLRLSASETASDNPIKVRFVAHFGLEHSDDQKQKQVAIQTIYSPYDSNIRLGPKHGPYQLVKITFSDGIAVRLLGSHSDREVVNPKIYDFSKVPCSDFKAGQSIDRWLHAFQSSWVQNGICPNPRMYEVQNSFWLREICEKKQGFNHYLLLGHDAYVEIIAKDWKWESEGSLRW